MGSAISKSYGYCDPLTGSEQEVLGGRICGIWPRTQPAALLDASLT